MQSLSRSALFPSAILFLLTLCHLKAAELSIPTTTTNKPIIEVYDPQATHNLLPQLEQVQAMVDQGLIELAGQPDIINAWQTLVQSNDVVAIKVYSSPGPSTGTRAAVVEAVVHDLIESAVVRTNIIIWDHSIVDLEKAGFGTLARRLGVRIQGALQAGYNESDFYEFALVTGLHFGDLEFGRTDDGVGRKSFLTKLLGPEVTKIISIAPASNKSSTGVTGHLYSMTLSSVDNSWRFETNPSTFSWAMPELYAKQSIGDRVVLCITDALICQYEGEDTTLLHYSAVANELYIGTDPVALDLLAIKLLKKQRDLTSSFQVTPDLNLYRNAALLQLGEDNLDLVPIKRITVGEPSTDGNAAPTNSSTSIQP